MQSARLLGGMALLIFASLPLRAESVPYDAFINIPQVEVRSGPSRDAQFYATTRLRQGSRVTVVKGENGWLAIKPPPGSFSWINSLILGPLSPARTAVVLANDAEVRVGSELSNEPPSVWQVRLKRGAQVLVLDQTKAFDSKGGWLPIQPPEQEVRYIPSDCVKANPQVQTVQSAPPVRTLGAVPPAPVTSQTGFVPDEILWQQAHQIELTNVGEAERLYRQLASQTTNHDLQMRCYNRIQFLRQDQQPIHVPVYQAARPMDSFAATPASRVTQAPVTPAIQTPSATPRLAQQTSQYTYAKEYAAPFPVGTAPASGYVQRPGLPVAVNQWSRGKLRRTSFFLDNRKTYALDSDQGEVQMYVTAQPGLELDGYHNRTVDVFGPLVYRGDMKKNYMVVQQIRMAQ